MTQQEEIERPKTFEDGIRTAHSNLQIMAMNNYGGDAEMEKIRAIENEALMRAADEIIELSESESINYKSIQDYQKRLADKQSQLSTALSEALALRVENEKFRRVLRQAQTHMVKASFNVIPPNHPF